MASLAGFRSQSVRIRGAGGSQDSIGTILLHRIGASENGATVSARSLAAPKDARKAFERGRDLVKRNDLDGAVREFRKAVALYPEYSTAWCELGDIQFARGQLDAARGWFQTTLHSDPAYVYPYVQLSRVELKAARWQQLAAATGKTLALDSFAYPQVFLFDTVAHYHLGDYALAEQSISRAEPLDKRHEFPQIVYLKVLLLLQHQDYAGAAECLRAYLKLGPDSADAPKVREQLKDIEAHAPHPPVNP